MIIEKTTDNSLVSSTLALIHKGRVRCNGEPFGEGFSGRLSQSEDGGRRGASDSDSDSDPGRGRGSNSGCGGDEGGDGEDDDRNSDPGDQLPGLARGTVDEGIIVPRHSTPLSTSPPGSSAPCSCSCSCLCSREEVSGGSSSSGPDSGGPMTSVTIRARSTL